MGRRNYAGRFVSPDGAYVRIKPGIWEKEPRVVMERHLGRPLRWNEHVYHRNGNPFDNRIENLRIKVRPRPNPWIDCECGCGLRIRMYGSDWRRRRFYYNHHTRVRRAS